MNFIKTPYLPKKKVSLAVADLEREDLRIIQPFCHEKLPLGIKKHADLTFCYLGSGVGVCAPEAYDYYRSAFSDINLCLVCGEKNLDRHYPSDASYNVAIVGDKIFCKKDITDKILLNEAEKMGYKIINMNQGYGKCSVCPVDKESAISADASFCKAAQKEGIDVLRVTNERISLPGYNCGFFGGMSYMEDEKTFVANGDLTYHQSYEQICDFLQRRDIKIKQSEGNLFDFGSFVAVMEE